MIPAEEALERLREGNHRYVSGARDGGTRTSPFRRNELVSGQEPFAVILGCADSRVPPEIVFDQGLGDLFVVRVAGNIVTPSQLGSIEMAAERFGTRLVVVLGHSQCGAVLLTLAELEGAPVSRSPDLRSIVDQIQPTVQPLLNTELRERRDALVQQAVRANVGASAERLRHDSPILADLIEKEGLRVVCADYSLETGAVDFFEG